MKKFYLILTFTLITLLAACGDEEKSDADNSESGKIPVTAESKSEEKEIYWNDLSEEEKERKVQEAIDSKVFPESFNVQDIVEELNKYADVNPINMAIDFESVISGISESLAAPGEIEILTVNEQLGNDSFTETDHPIIKIIEKDDTVFVFHGHSGYTAFYLSVAKDNKWIFKDKLIHDGEEVSMYSEDIQQTLIEQEMQYGGNTYRYYTQGSVIEHKINDHINKSIVIESTFDETGITGSKIISQEYFEAFSIVNTLGGEQLFMTELADGDLTHVNIYEDTNLNNSIYSYDVKFKDYWKLRSNYTFLDRDRNFLYTGDDSVTIKIDVTTGEPNWDAQGHLIEYDIPYDNSYFIGDDFGLIVTSEPDYDHKIYISRYDYDLNMMNESLFIDNGATGSHDFEGGAKTNEELHVWREVEYKDQRSIQMTPFSID